MLIETAEELVKHRHIYNGVDLPKDERVTSVRIKMMLSAEANSGVPDVLQFCKYCTTCASHKVGPTMIALDKNPEYSDLYELIAGALQADGGAMLKSARKCKTCAQHLTLFRDYHRYDADRKQDIVVRAFFESPDDGFLSYCVLWMDANGQMQLAPESEVQNALDMVRQSMVSEAKGSLQSDDLPKCAEFTKFLLQHFPSSAELVSIAYQLVDTNKRGLSEAIGQNLIDTDPNNPEGYSLIAQVFLRGYTDSAGTVPELLAEAYHYCQLALERDSEHAPAQLSYCNCLRLRNEDPSLVTAAIVDAGKVVSKAATLVPQHPQLATLVSQTGTH